jgi:hypothetical protein
MMQCVCKIVVAMSLILILSSVCAKLVIYVQGIGPEIAPKIEEPPSLGVSDNKIVSSTQDVQTTDQQIMDPDKGSTLMDATGDESPDAHTSHGHGPHNSDRDTNQDLTSSSTHIGSGSSSSSSFIAVILIFAVILVFIILVWIAIIKRFRKSLESHHNMHSNKNRS